MRPSLIAFAAAALVAPPAYAQVSPDSPAATSESSTEASPVADAAPAPAADRGGDFYCRRKLGTWFYCEKSKARPATPKSPPPAQSSAVERLREVTATLDEL